MPYTQVELSVYVETASPSDAAREAVEKIRSGSDPDRIYALRWAGTPDDSGGLIESNFVPVPSLHEKDPLADRIKSAVALRHPAYREGQAAFHELALLDPETANRISSTELDPHYDDSRLDAFYAHLGSRR